jgi:hypothetical protein
MGFQWVMGCCLLGSWGCGGTIHATESEGQDAGVDAPFEVGLPDTLQMDTSEETQDVSFADTFEEYTDPGCPDAPAALISFECDPLAPPPGDCEQGEACYPYVGYPSEPCEAEVYGSYCRVAGINAQGEICDSGEDCAAGFVCVVSGSGTQCVRLCSLTDISSCPDGMVCEPIDVVGMGGCL